MKASSPVREVVSFAHDIIAGTPVPRVASFGVIAMAAVALLAMLPVAQVELSQASEVPNMAMRSTMAGHGDAPQVLGQQTYEPTQVFANGQVKVWVTPHEYDGVSGKWNYKVSWVREGKRQGSIAINGNMFVKQASGRGEQFTGFHLQPNETYRLTFYSLYNGKGVRVANNRAFTVLAADEKEAIVDDETEDDGAPTTGTGTPPVKDPTNTGSYNPNIPTKPHFEFITKTLPSGTVGVAYTTKIYFRYVIPTGATNYASNAVFTGLPSGIGTGSASGNNTIMGILPGLEGPNGLASMTISGTPTAVGSSKVQVALTDQYSANAKETFLMTINATR